VTTLRAGGTETGANAMTQVSFDQQSGIAYITLNRPEVLNALTDTIIKELRSALFRLDDDPDAMVGILSGSGRAFCSGADVRQRQLRSREELERIGTQDRGAYIQDVMLGFTHWKPLIAAVHGYVMGAGLYLALMCEQIIAAEGTMFQITETSRGADPTAFWSLLAHRSSEAFATNVAMTGRFWTAEEALAQRAVDKVVPEGTHVSAAAEFIRDQVLPNPPLSVRAVVEARRGVFEELELRSRLRRPRALHLTEDFHESAKAFTEKRPPVYRGR